MIGIIDYGAGNLFSVLNSIRYLGYPVKVLKDPSEFKDVDRIVLPGVGSFGIAIQNLISSRFYNSILEWIDSKRPFLGICLGLQLLFEFSEESPGVKGLSIIRGYVKKFNVKKVPHIGWNLAMVCGDSAFSKSLKDDFYYFIHSYYVVPEEDVGLFKTEYYIEYISGIIKDNIVAVQFHPEKSSFAGLNFLKKWIELC
ncbi:MAG: imidazole glycerol phosphate synthase subunit HisH [Deltaproteobacteria bacterium]|nr:imidazole glycerol phosphate synthase subunit HisH [Deltaproteobacteria bacterium]